MSLPAFDYVKAESIEEASGLAAGKGKNAVIMAGGTDVILLLKERVIRPDTVIDIKEIEGLNGITFTEDEGMKIGALTKLYEIQNSPLVKEKMPALADAAHYVASAQIRRKGTMVGNICNASPSADTAPILVAMNAKVRVQNGSEIREIEISDFFKGVKKTSLVPGDIVTEVVIPGLKDNEGSAYFKHSVRKAMDLAIVGVACWIRMDGDKVADCRIAMGGVGITPLRARKAEELLRGQKIDADILEAAATAASGECSPISDVRASAEYRTDMIRVYTKRAIKKAVETLA